MGRGLPFCGFSESGKSRIHYVISDVDDTITSCGRLLPEALAALYSARKCGKKTILLTGGSAGWADVYIRQWPVDGVVAESGALYIYMKDGKVIYEANPLIDDGYMERKNSFISFAGPDTLSSDQYARLYDVAIDKSLIDEEGRERILEEVKRTGAFHAESSIHINVWFSPYDKWSGLRYFMKRHFALDEPALKNSSVYLGDGLNDQPLFREIPLSVGMNSVERNRDAFRILPEYIADKDGGLGFRDVIESLIKNNS